MATQSIFINYRREDSKWFAVLLKEKIEAAFDSIRVFLDTEDIKLGADWPDTLEQELQKSSIILSLVGEKWLLCYDDYGFRKLDKENDWVRKEIEWALDSDKELIVILVDIKDATKRPSENAFGKETQKLKGILRKQHLEVRSKNFSSDFQPLKDYLAKTLNLTPLNPIKSVKRENILRGYPLSKAVREEMPSRPLAPGSDLKWKHCPFVGLNYFTRDTARLYFGREKDLLELILIIQNQQHRLIYLHGYSGVGKSSLLSAGLIPRLEENWLPLYHRRDKAVGLGQGLRNLRKKASKDIRPTLYILDQVEEIFTDLSIEDEQPNFLSELTMAIKQEPRATFLLGFRSEYLPKVDRLCWNIPGVKEKEILPLSRAEVIQSITGVWKDEYLNAKYRLKIEENLPERIADHLSQHQIRDYIAPILQNRLERLWEKAFKGPGQDVKLTKDLYAELGDASEKEILISRLERVRQQTNWDEEKALRVLEKFVIDLPSAGAVKKGELDITFEDVIDYREVLEELQKVDLLIEEEKGQDGGTIRLSHDLLAKSIRAQYDEFQTLQTFKLKEENFDLLFKEAIEALLELEYDKAANILEKAIKTGVKKEQLTQLVTELIYFYNEAGKPNEAFRLLKLGEKEDILKNTALIRSEELEPEKKQFKRQLREFLQEQDSMFFSKLERCYYPETIAVEGGIFEMEQEESKNDSEEEKNEHDNNKRLPIIQVKLNNFYICSTPVTFRQYCLFCEATHRPYPEDNEFGKNRRPVINVNWYDAIEYSNWLSEMKGLPKVYAIDKEKKDSKNLSLSDEKKWQIVVERGNTGYRLPTEAEWEFAARGGGQRPGDQFAGSENPIKVGWYKENSESQTHPVEEKNPNELGLYDMSGNVWEWCWNWYSSNNYEEEIVEVQNPKGPDSGSARVLRGGSWDAEYNYGSCAYRFERPPFSRDIDIGFRLVRTNSE